MQHPNHVLWLNHRMREYYDLWDQFSSHLSWKGKIKERTRRAIIHRVDNHLLGKMQRRFVISGTVQTRLRRFGGISSDVLYPPPPKRDYRHDTYGDYLFGVSRLSPLKRFDLVLRALAEPMAAEHQVRDCRRGRRDRRADEAAQPPRARASRAVRRAGWMKPASCITWRAAAR